MVFRVTIRKSTTYKRTMGPFVHRGIECTDSRAQRMTIRLASFNAVVVAECWPFYYAFIVIELGIFMRTAPVIDGLGQRSALGARTASGLIVLGLAAALVGCGTADDESDQGSSAAPEHSAAAQTSDRPRCPTGDALISRARQLEAHGSDAAIRRWTRAARAGPDDKGSDGMSAGCASFQTLSDRQTRTYVDILYQGRPDMAAALVLHQSTAAQQAILRAYRNDPDAVTDSPNLAGAVAMAQIQQGRNYQSAYHDLAFAALNGGVAPSYVRGYLAHFGCGYEDAVWAVKTTRSTDFFQGDAFPNSTTRADVDQSELVNDRMALLKDATVPTLRAGCPLSVQYAADHNGDALTRMKLKAKELKDRWDAKLKEYVDKLTPDDDPPQPHNENSTAGRLRRQWVESYAELRDFAFQAGELADNRWDACSDRLDSGFQSIIACLKNDMPENRSDQTGDNDQNSS